MSLHRVNAPDPGTLTTEIVCEIDRDKHILLYMLDLHREKVAPLDLTTMLYEITPNTEDSFPQDPTELSKAFLQRLWVSNPQTRSTCCQKVVGEYGLDMDEDSKCAINPLDLVAAVYMTTNNFLQQEITQRMLQCNFAVPLFIPPLHPEKKGTMLLCAFRGVLGEWSSSEGIAVKNMANSRMPFISAVRLGRCGVSKSRVLNLVLGGQHKLNDTFINSGMEGGQLPRVLSDGLVEVCWNLPSDDHHDNVFPRPVLVANLRGDAADFEKQMGLLCYASGVLVVFCESFGAKERELLASWRDNTSHMIIIDCSVSDEGQDNQNDKIKQRVVKDLELPEGAMLDGYEGNEEAIAENLRDVLIRFIPYLHTSNLVGAAGMANDLDIKVDEDEICRTAFSEVEEVLFGVEDGVSSYLENQLPLQGAVWKRLCQLEKEEVRHQHHSNQNLIEEKENLIKQLLDYQLTTSMRAFIAALCSMDTNKRAYFLSWMRVKLEVMQLDRLSLLRTSDEEQVQEPCIGLEHFLREMGLIYERYFRGPNSDLYDMYRLPYVGAELLLYGVPLELYDGDASVFPMNWVYSVLYEVYRQLPKFSRMRVLTILGFNNSKNAEILSAMFGVNFPKWGRRHIKGAYMLLLSLPDNFRMEMDCEFLMVISTEGLNRQTERNFVHDCELATFVSGLSDITLVNLPDEGQDETRCNLQIALNALLCTRNVERKTTFQVASDGVDGMSGKIMRCVIDVLTRGHLPNVFQREPPFINESEGISLNPSSPWTSNSMTGQNHQIHSDAVHRLKKDLLTMFHDKAINGQPTCLGAFMEHMCNLWELVKKGNFATTFGDTETANAIIGLCTKLVLGEKHLNDQMDLWVEGLDNHITELAETASQIGEDMDSDAILGVLRNEAATQINTEKDQIEASLWNYLRQEDIDISLVENYKASLLKKVDLIYKQTTSDVGQKLESATYRHDMTIKMHALLTSLEAALEVKLRSLLQTCKNNDCVIKDKELEQEFLGIWEDIPSNVRDPPLETPKIIERMVEQLKENLSACGIKKQNIRLQNADQLNDFKVKTIHFALSSKVKKTLKYNKNVAQKFTNNLIEDCENRISDKLSHKEGYSDSYMRELLAILDKGLEVLKTESFTMSPKFEVDIKRYICSKAAKSFEEMQMALNKERQTKDEFLNETKDKHMLNFIYQFRKRHQCQKAAQSFTNLCLKPAAEDFIYSSLERQIFNDMLQNEKAWLYTSPRKFHYGLLKEMLLKDSFETFHEYLQSYERFSQKNIDSFIKTHLSGSVMIEDRRELRMQQIFDWVKKCILQASESCSGAQSNVRQLLETICDSLETQANISMPTQILEKPLFDINTQPELFLANLQESVFELSSAISQDFMENEDVIEVPDDLPNKLQDMLYKTVKGCDKCCPFCKAPCDLEVKDHQVHEAVVHRPKGLVCYTDANSTTLSHNTCSADISGQNQFQNRHTGGKSVPFKEYQSIYPDWIISPEDPRNNGAAVYWRYVFMRHNNRFAQEYQCAPASLPEAWGKITQKEALQSLREAFEIKE